MTRSSTRSKSAAVPGIGVGHLARLARKFEEQLDPRPRARRTQRAQRAQVAPVHGQDEIESREVLPFHLTRTQAAQVDVAGRGGAPAARIRGLSQVIVAGPRGVDFDIERGRLGRA